MNAGRTFKEGESVRPAILGAENNSNLLMRRQSLEKPPGNITILSINFYYFDSTYCNTSFHLSF